MHLHLKYKFSLYYHAFIFFLSLMLSFLLCCSCSSDTPAISHETDFYEKYYIDDPNLFWTDAGTWEKITYKTPVNSSIEWDELVYATIPDTDPELFLVTRRAEYSFFEPYEVFSLYQSHEAPIPTKDWTIADIQIIKGILFSDPNDANTYRQFYQTMIDNETPVFTWSEQGCPTNLAEEIQTSWNSQLIDLKDLKCKETVYLYYSDNENIPHYKNYILCVQFKENPNIVWMATLYEGQDGYYLGRAGQVNEIWYMQEVKQVYPMGENWNLVLTDILHDAQ